MLTRLTKAIVACAVLAPASAFAIPVTVDFTITYDTFYGATYNGQGVGATGSGSFTVDSLTGSVNDSTVGAPALDLSFNFLGASFDETNARFWQLQFDPAGNIVNWGIGAASCNLSCIYGGSDSNSPTDFFAYSTGANAGYAAVHVENVYYFGGGNISWTQRPASVPEPATLGLLGLGLLGMGLARRKRAA